MDDENGSVQSERKVGIVNKFAMLVVGVGAMALSAVVFASVIAGAVWLVAAYAGVLSDVVSNAFDTGKSII